MNAQTYEQPPSVAERADDALYANAVNALAAVFRMDIEDAQKRFGRPNAQFDHILRHIGRLLADGCTETGGLYPRDVFDQYGPGAVLLALKRAYTEQQPSAPLVGD